MNKCENKSPPPPHRRSARSSSLRRAGASSHPPFPPLWMAPQRSHPRSPQSRKQWSSCAASAPRARCRACRLGRGGELFRDKLWGKKYYLGKNYGEKIAWEVSRELFTEKWWGKNRMTHTGKTYNDQVSRHLWGIPHLIKKKLMKIKVQGLQKKW